MGDKQKVNTSNFLYKSISYLIATYNKLSFCNCIIYTLAINITTRQSHMCCFNCV